jgi:hypothetical protein
MKLEAAQLDRALGVIWGQAAGESLTSISSGGWGEGVSLSIPVLEVLGAGLDICAADTQGRIVRRWIEWVLSIPDSETPSRAQAVLTKLARHDWDAQGDDTVGLACAQAARAIRTPPAGTECGALARSGALALGYLGKEDGAALAQAAAALAGLTAPAAETAEACIMWSAAVRAAVLTGRADMHAGLKHIKSHRVKETGVVPDTGRCVSNLLAAYLAASRGGKSFRTNMEAVVERREAAYTPAAVALAGALGGAELGGKAVPEDYRKNAHGWPGIVDDALERLVTEAIEASAISVITAPSEAAPHYGSAPWGAIDTSAPPFDEAPAYMSPTGSGVPLPPAYDAPPPVYN